MDFFETYETKDKLAKLIQYGSLLMVWHSQRNGQASHAKKWTQVMDAAESFREVGWLLCWVSPIASLIRRFQRPTDDPKPLKTTLKIVTHSADLLGGLSDNILWLQEHQLIKFKSRQSKFLDSFNFWADAASCLLWFYWAIHQYQKTLTKPFWKLSIFSLLMRVEVLDIFAELATLQIALSYNFPRTFPVPLVGALGVISSVLGLIVDYRSMEDENEEEEKETEQPETKSEEPEVEESELIEDCYYDKNFEEYTDA